MWAFPFETLLAFVEMHLNVLDLRQPIFFKESIYQHPSNSTDGLSNKKTKNLKNLDFQFMELERIVVVLQRYNQVLEE